MSRLPLLSADTADAEQGELLTEVQRQLGRVPNLYAAMANSPATLRGYLRLRDALTAGKLGARTREQLALLIAADNGCEYCVSAHTMRASKMGFTPEAIAATRAARAEDPHAEAVLRFAREVQRTGGRVDDERLAEARSSGVSDAELTEAVGHVALNVLSNYFNHVARPELDFPLAPTPPKAPATTSRWRAADTVGLVAGYTLTDADGRQTATVRDVHVAIEGGFAHISVKDGERVQVVSAPAIALITYRPES
ncbi:alkylhydroperoxidase [Nocardia sp. MH4]|uniref:carboxymuconolactone decarboxylase family protein n=1 Tax=unclassified Nocardia TaxID=2637762 RepID=UPI001C4EC3A9|nr:carboxymuconolactone decarboxylase family protein [Nocardia sp. MH4]MBW0271201.1 alkylhydroperoxidase [Nocardia sp. MH4]